MIKIDFGKLNPLEKQIHQTLAEQAKRSDTIRITDAAELCECSVSKISKFASKLGFENYKQYLEFLYGREVPEINQSSELGRIKNFLEAFDFSLVEEMAKLIMASEKLVLMGYGPSYLCAQYFEYRFMTCLNKISISTSDELVAASMTDKNTLLVAFTATGSFKSFEQIFRDTKAKGGEVALLIDEYNPDIIRKYDKVFCLGNALQSPILQPYEKSRTTFFIFMEEVVQEVMRLR